MYTEPILFAPDLPIAYEGWQVGNYHLHSHQDVIEIFLVLKGKVDLTVSFERFEMNQGDYVVIGNYDSHSFSANSADCEVVSLYLRMQDYKEKIPYLYYVLFACESFDLAKYRNETAKIRLLITSILLRLIQGSKEDLVIAKKTAEQLIWLLVNDYDMIKYYNRKWDVPYKKIEKYYTITGYLFEHYSMKNLLEYIAQKEHYSKSYISHLFREISSSSIKDNLEFIKVYKSEEKLITTDISIAEISEQCGFSDVKYYTANFKKWYLCTPSEYRKKAVALMNRPNVVHTLDPSRIYNAVALLSQASMEDSKYIAAVTPLSIKAFGTSDQESSLEGSDRTDDVNPVGPVKGAYHVMDDRTATTPHGIRLKLGPEILEETSETLGLKIQSLTNQRFVPILVIDRGELTTSTCKKMVEKCIEAIKVDPVPSAFQIQLVYHDLVHYDSINKLVKEMQVRYGIDAIQPIFWS